MARARDTSDLWAPDSWLPAAWAPDSERSQLSLGRAIELTLAAKGAEGALAQDTPVVSDPSRVRHQARHQ